MLKRITERLNTMPVDRIRPFGVEGVEAAILVALTREPANPKIIFT